jgi:hypothetical protein
MKTSSCFILGGGAALCLVGAAAPALAHHSFAMFDRAKTLNLEGTVTEFQFTNPHSWLEIDVATATGKQHWSLEMNNLVGLRRVGWRAKTLKPGDKVKAVMHPMRDGSAGGQLVSVVLPDGEFYDGQGLHPAGGAAAPAPASGPATPIVN